MQSDHISFSHGAYGLPEYPFHMPPELAGNAAPRYPVAIVGAGLTGLTAACALADLGIDVVLLDDDKTVGVRGASSRGVCYSQKSLEIFARLGIYARIREKGVSWSVGRSYAGDEQICCFDLEGFDLATGAQASSSAQPSFINLQQFYVESFLVERARQMPALDLRWQSRVEACEQDQECVRLEVQTPAGNYSLRAEWVVDCSGAHSSLRAEAPGKSARTDDRWLICDVFFEKPPPHERRTWISAPFNQGRAAWQHVMADNICRVDYQLGPQCDLLQAASEAAIRERLRRQFGPQASFQVVWVGAWTYRSECLTQFRDRRVLHAGDAAHVMSPFGGRGGNSGIQDADNLAWKLAMVLNGKADAALLDTYCEERRPAALENIRISDRTTRFLHPPAPAERIYRDVVVALARKHGFAQSLVNTGRMTLPSVYTHSRLNVGTGGGRSVPNFPVVLADGRRGDLAQLLRWADGNFIAVVRNPGRRHHALERRHPVRIVAADQLEAGFATLVAAANEPAAQAVILRPDSYCAGGLAPNDAAALDDALRVLTCR
ncbi:MAG TPA: FAD-dependent oxidoreductase [Steroidobacteraceae bacterium]|nr:FAD-dependent oxidoreductase [Steroidobacteraceae bacterium]